MHKKFLVYVIIIMIIFSFATNPLAISIKEMNALKLHIDSVVVDSHNDSMMLVVDEKTWLPKINIRENTNNHIDIPKMRAGNLRVGFFAAYTNSYNGNSKRALSRTLALINALYWTEKNNSDVFNITSTFNEIEEAVLDWKIAAVPTIEGAYSMTKNNADKLLDQYNDLGIKAIAFTWNYSNELGEGANEIYDDGNNTPSAKGLTDLGREMVRKMNRLGIIVDVSHLNTTTFWDVLNTTKAPIIASHSGAYAIKPHRRNLNDAQLKAIADNGGVVGLVLYREFVKDMEDAYIRDYVDHIDYVVELIGIDHVGIGSDFDGGELPYDMKDVSDLYKITEELVKRGYGKEDIKKILGRNTLRVIKEVERLAEEKKEAQDIEIIPFVEMGQGLESNLPELSAKVVGNNLDLNKFRVIIDGISYPPLFNVESSTISIKLKEPLVERFHVISFEASNNSGQTKRDTRIFYVK